MNYEELVEDLKAKGCTWIQHSSHWDGAGWVVDESGRATGMVMFGVYYRPTMGMDHSRWESYGVSRYGDNFRPSTKEHTKTGSGYCYPIDDIIEVRRNIESLSILAKEMGLAVV